VRQQQTPQPRWAARTETGVLFCGGDCLNLYCKETFKKRCFSATAASFASCASRAGPKPGSGGRKFQQMRMVYAQNRHK